MPWDEAFWNGTGYETLVKHMRTGNDAAKTAAKLLHEKASLDAEYAKGLSKLSKSVASLAKEDFGTMKAFWDNLRLEIDNQAKQFQQIHAGIENDIIKGLETFREEQTKHRTGLDKKYLAADKAYQTAKLAEQKSRKTSYSASKAAEQAAEAVTKSAGNEKELAKANKNYEKAKKDADAAEKDFRLSVRKVRETKLSWEGAFVTCCLEYQAQDQARISHLRQDLEKFADIHLNVYPQLTDSHNKIRNDTAQIDANADIEAAAQQKGTGNQRPDDVLYQTYALDQKNPMAAQRRGESVSVTIGEIEADIASQQKGLAGMENLLKVYKDQPSFANDTTRVTSEHQLNSIKNYMAKLQDLHSQYSQILGSTGVSRGSTSYASTSYSAEEDSSSYSNSSFASPPAASTAAPAVGGKCRAMYDFTASNESELSIKEGDVLTIVGMDDPEWWTVSLGGQQGFVPNTYVEVI